MNLIAKYYAISPGDMETYHERAYGNGLVDNGHCTSRSYDYQSSSSSIKSSLSWLDLRVFYVRLSKCEIDESTPGHLTLNHVPLNHDTLLEVNGVRTSIYSDGVSTLLRRDRVDKKSEEVTFVSTDSIRMTGSVKFEVFDQDVLVLSGSLQVCDSNGFAGAESRNNEHYWSMNCESDILQETGLLQGNQNQYTSSEPGSPAIEVYVAGCFLGSPIILTKTLHLGQRRKQMRKTMLDSIPEYEASLYQKDSPSSTLGMQVVEENACKPENEDYNHHYPRYLDGEDEELSWFNAGVRVGVGIGLSICVGVGIGVGLIAKAYQGTTRNFRRRLF